MGALRYTKPEVVSLKDHPDFNEAWLQERISEDTSVLGLGELDVIERERRQDKAGRLDMLLYDRRENCRYEVELMLGTTDESHILRCLEYWDIERRRYPAYDHCAVLVAENITSRFLNILSLFAGTIPFVAIQLSALKVSDQIVLNFVRVLDRVALRQDDEAEVATAPTDRKYWEDRASPATVAMVDAFLDIVNQKMSSRLQLNYTKYYIGLNDGNRARNFIYFTPRKQYTYINASTADAQKWASRMEEQGLSAGVDARTGYLWVSVKPKELEQYSSPLKEMLHAAVDRHQAD